MTSQQMPETLTLDQLPWAGLTYVLEPLKVVYVGVPKNACTSLTWLTAELAGEDLSTFQPGLTWLLNSELAIHQRRLFRHTRTLVSVAPEVRRQISPDNGWFVFGTVRDPRARVFSAWQNKLLLHDPKYDQWREEDWYPAPPERAEHVVRDFARFVELIHAEPEHPIAQDPHVRDQMHFLRPDLIPYSRIYDVTEMSTLLGALGAHLRAQGLDRDLTLRRANDTVLRANGAALPEKVRSRIEELHAVDFERFGHLWDFGRIERAGEWTSDAVQEVRARILLHERIGGLLKIARDGQERIEQLEQQHMLAERKLDAVRQRARAGRRRLARARRRAAAAESRVRALESMRSTRVGMAARRVRRRLRGLK